jgi:flavin-dependent dehydrogenase
MRVQTDFDIIVVGAGFAGLMAAATAAARGLRVGVLESKTRPSAQIHTTGILVKEAAEELDVPLHLTRKIRGVRLYAPNLHHVDITAPGYYFLATDTGSLLDWLAARAELAGARIFTSARFERARVRDGRVELSPSDLTTRFVIGADGPRSAVARAFSLGINRSFLTGVEVELPMEENDSVEMLHCFFDSRLAPGYLGWSVPGVGIQQVGLAVRDGRKVRLDAFLEKVKSVLHIDPRAETERRGGKIPCGGLVHPFADRYAVLVGDAAGLVSPLTGGGIHCALRYGRRAALSVCDYLCEGGAHPGAALARQYPKFTAKRSLRAIMNLAPPNPLFNLVIDHPGFLFLAQSIFFHSRGAVWEGADGAPENLRKTASSLL